MTTELIPTLLAVASMLMAGCGFMTSDYRTSVRWWAGAFALKTIETMMVRSQLTRRRRLNNLKGEQ